MHCLQRKTVNVGKCSAGRAGGEGKHPLLRIAEQARQLGHEVWAAGILEDTAEEAPVAVCRRCGGWSRGSDPKKLRSQCQPPTKKGAEVWGRMVAGRHPDTKVPKGRTVELAPWPRYVVAEEEDAGVA